MQDKQYMTLEVTQGTTDRFTNNSQFAYKDGKIYNILESSKQYFAGMCWGTMKVIVKDDNVLHWIYPLMGGGDYEILDNDKINHMKSILKAVEEFENNE